MEELSSGAHILSQFSTLLLDCDGVLWNADTIIPGVPETISKLRELGKRIFFVTNNSTKSRQQYAVKIRKLGIDGVTEGDILSTSYATAQYLKGKCDKVYMIGEDGLRRELEEAGIQCIGMDDHDKKYRMEDMADVETPSDIGAVVCGLDQSFNMYKLAYAFLCLKQHAKCLFIATNRDRTFPLSEGVVLPGTGALISALSTAIGRQPDVTIGKPEPLFLDIIAKTGVELDPKKTCMIGDRLDTDIAFGKSRGLATLLVLTGVTTREDVRAPSNDIHPDYILASLANLAR